MFSNSNGNSNSSIGFIYNTTIKRKTKHFVDITKQIEALLHLHSARGHQGSHKAHQAGN